MLDRVRTEQKQDNRPPENSLTGQKGRLAQAEKMIVGLRKLWDFTGASLNGEPWQNHQINTSEIALRPQFAELLLQQCTELMEINYRIGQPIDDDMWPYILKTLAVPLEDRNDTKDAKEIRRRRRRASEEFDDDFFTPQEAVQRVQEIWEKRGTTLRGRPWLDHDVNLDEAGITTDSPRIKKRIIRECTRFLEMSHRLGIEPDADIRQGAFNVIAQEITQQAEVRRGEVSAIRRAAALKHIHGIEEPPVRPSVYETRTKSEANKRLARQQQNPVVLEPTLSETAKAHFQRAEARIVDVTAAWAAAGKSSLLMNQTKREFELPEFDPPLAKIRGVTTQVRRVCQEFSEICDRLEMPLTDEERPYIFTLLGREAAALAGQRQQHIDLRPVWLDLEESRLVQEAEEIIASVRLEWALRDKTLNGKWQNSQIELPITNPPFPKIKGLENKISHACCGFLEMCHRMDVELPETIKPVIFTLLGREISSEVAHMHAELTEKKRALRIAMNQKQSADTIEPAPEA
jgi:hypothetical protein